MGITLGVGMIKEILFILVDMLRVRFFLLAPVLNKGRVQGWAQRNLENHRVMMLS